MSGIGIRRAGLDDLDALVPLFDCYRRFYGQPGDLPRARGFLHERLASGESVVLLAGIAADGSGPAAGFAQLFPLFSSVRTARAWLLNDLFVAIDARRRGVGRALLEAAAAFARADGAVSLMLETARGNDDARALYRSAGWREDDTQWYSLDLAAGD